MAAADHGGPGPDLYRLLGVPQEASREEIAQAWRRRARDEHPDARPADANAPGRFRALAEAYHVLGDPARRAAYDRAQAGELAELMLRHLARHRGRRWLRQQNAALPAKRAALKTATSTSDPG